MLETDRYVTDFAEINGTLLCATQYRPEIFGSGDNGQNWDTMPIPLWSSEDFSRLSVVNDAIYAWGESPIRGIGSDVVKMEGLGATWTNFSYEMENLLGFYPRALCEADSAFYAYDDSSIARSFDEGQSWEMAAQGLESSFSPILAGGGILMRFLGEMFAPVPYVSLDYGLTFQPVNGLPSEYPSFSGVRYTSLLHLGGAYLITSNIGLFFSYDNGLNWVHYSPAPLPPYSLTSSILVQDTVYVGTSNSGVWKAALSSLPLDPTTGIKNEDVKGNGRENAEMSFYLSPNPTSGALLIRLNDEAYFEGRLLIFDSRGMLRLGLPLRFKGQYFLPDLKLPAGYYNAVLENGKKLYKASFILQH